MKKSDVCPKCGAVMFRIQPLLRFAGPMPPKEKMDAFMKKKHCIRCESQDDMERQLYGDQK